MIDAGKTLVDPIGCCSDIGDSETVETCGVLSDISFSAGDIGEKINAAGNLAFRIFGLHFPNQTGLLGDISGEVSVGGLSIGTERAGRREFEN